MSARAVFVLTLFVSLSSTLSSFAQPLDPSQEVALDREGHASFWALDTPLEAPFRQRVGMRFTARLTRWMSGWGELRIAWAQKPSVFRAGVSVWPIGDPLRGALVSAGPSLLVLPGAASELDAFVETGLRYGWEGIALTLVARWDLKRPQAVPTLSLMFGYTFAGTS